MAARLNAGLADPGLVPDSASLSGNPSEFMLQYGARTATRSQPIAALARAGWSGRLARRSTLVVILVYLVVSRVGGLPASKLAIEVGSTPIFLTDLTLGLLLLITMRENPARLLWWSTTGRGTGLVGTAVWLLLITATVYFAVAFQEYRVFALRDLAIFSYGLFFPLTYLAIGSRADVDHLLRGFAYSGALVAALVLFQAATGIHLGVDSGERYLFGQSVARFASGDEGAVIASSFGVLLGYAAFERRSRKFHLALLGICSAAIVISTVRSGLIGVLLAFLLTFIVGSSRHRLGISVAGIAIGVLVILGAQIPRYELPGFLQSFYLSLGSAAGGAADPTAAFRILRWKYAWELWWTHPFLGVGYGVPLLPYSLDPDNFHLGFFNGGMPHNTFLFVLDRMGLPGIALVGFCSIAGLWSVARGAFRHRRADDLAAANLLLAMLAYGTLNLFFERPAHNAAFWIALAIAMRLTEASRVSLRRPHVAVVQPRAMLRAGRRAVA